MASDLLTNIRVEIDARLGELRPLVSEYERLLAAAEALADAGASERSTARRPSSPRAPAGPSSPAPIRRPRGPRGSAAGTIRRASSPRAGLGYAPASTREIGVEGRETGREERKKVGNAGQVVKSERAARGAAQQAILAALEHGSHTVGELVVVTAMSGANIRGNLRRLLKERTVTRTKRDGKAAYALPAPR